MGLQQYSLAHVSRMMDAMGTDVWQIVAINSHQCITHVYIPSHAVFVSSWVRMVWLGWFRMVPSTRCIIQ